MTDNVNSTGVSMDQDELSDPSDNANAPDPLIGEQPRSGALAAVGSKADQQSRVTGSRAAMDALREQYAGAAGQANDAYAAQKKTLQDATQRLMAMQMGPGAQEQAYRVAAAVGTGEPGTGRYNPAGVSTAHADILAQQREAEMAKQQLMTQYGMQIPQAQLGAANQRLNQITQQMRIQQSDLNNASNKADTQQKLVDKYYTQDPNDPNKLIDHPEMRAADVAQATQQAGDVAKAKLAAQASMTGMVTPEAIEIAYRTGKAPSGFSRSPMVNQQLWKGVHERAAVEGNSPAQFFAQTQMTAASNGVIKDFESGPTSKSIDGINTAIKHTEVLSPLVDALDNTNVKAANFVKNWFDTNIKGTSAPNNFDTVKEFVSGEIAKAVLPAGGGEREREQIANAVNKSNSPQMLRDAIGLWSKLLAGKTDSLRLRWENSTVGQPAFNDKFLLPETKKALGIQAANPVVARPGQTSQNPLVQSYLPGGANYKAPQ